MKEARKRVEQNKRKIAIDKKTKTFQAKMKEQETLKRS